MDQKERAAWLIKYLEQEMPEYGSREVPDDDQEAFDLFRALCNVRMPGTVSNEFLDIQDAYLKEETQKKGITDSHTLKPASSDRRIFLWQGDITTMKCDAIVNAANSQMLGCFRSLHNCIDKARPKPRSVESTACPRPHCPDGSKPTRPSQPKTARS
jgi:hypothetical protein